MPCKLQTVHNVEYAVNMHNHLSQWVFVTVTYGVYGKCMHCSEAVLVLRLKALFSNAF